MVKHLLANAGDTRDVSSIPASGRSPRGRNGNSLVLLRGKSYGQRSLMGYSLWGCKELDMLSMHTSHNTWINRVLSQAMFNTGAENA